MIPLTNSEESPNLRTNIVSAPMSNDYRWNVANSRIVAHCNEQNELLRQQPRAALQCAISVMHELLLRASHLQEWTTEDSPRGALAYHSSNFRVLPALIRVYLSRKLAEPFDTCDGRRRS